MNFRGEVEMLEGIVLKCNHSNEQQGCEEYEALKESIPIWKQEWNLDLVKLYQDRIGLSSHMYFIHLQQCRHPL